MVLTAATPRCFVSIPHSRAGLLERIIGPALQAAGILEVRSSPLGDESVDSVQSLLYLADLMIADVTNLNPNVMFELGMWMGLGKPAFLMGAANTSLPSSLANLKIHFYIDDDQAILRELPLVLDQFLRSVVPGPRNHARHVQESLPVVGSWTKSTVNSSADAWQQRIEQLTRLRAWDEVIRAIETAPQSTRESPANMRALAVALSHSGRPQDAERALTILEALRGQAPESELSRAIARIRELRYFRTRSSRDLVLAVDSYGAAIKLAPDDLELAISFLKLLDQLGDDANPDEIRRQSTRIHALLSEAFTKPPIDYWTFAAAVELAALERNWDQAEELLAQSLRLPEVQRSMVDKLASSLELIARSLKGRHRQQMNNLLGMLQSAGVDR